MDEIIGSLFTIYVVISVIISLIKRAQRGPVQSDWPDVETELPDPTNTSPEFQGQEPRLEEIHTIEAQSYDEPELPRQFDPVMLAEATDQLEPDLDDLSEDGDSLLPRQRTSRLKDGQNRKKQASRRILADKDDLRRGLVMAEILGPPRAMRRSHRLEGTRMHIR